MFSRGIRLGDGDVDDDEKTHNSRNCCQQIIHLPCRMVQSVAGWFLTCWRHQESRRNSHISNSSSSSSGGGASRRRRGPVDDCRPLLGGGRERGTPTTPRFPTHAAASFLKTGTSRKMRDANSIL
ncbi:hypothetical protein JDV02_009045 [Purpureocillium takamizusanense]|uniref:Uncharacterized protein n=1 Tax=Purpureocillium takamizusanense TaxID=2060973 RepID=A0A9Q8QP42_9HYPO|nr:uncharacterized protein JDV02_009045 [Purpureocillium takamizusanense]UNI23213.1 hypothetical protein JDV02_009045 [Purpureocillium takamizusanense]